MKLVLGLGRRWWLLEQREERSTVRADTFDLLYDVSDDGHNDDDLVPSASASSGTPFRKTNMQVASEERESGVRHGSRGKISGASSVAG